MSPRPKAMSLGAPSPVGAPPMPPGAGMGMEPDGDEGQGILSPDTIGYHPDPRSCGNCKHDQNDTCELTGTPVNDAGGCKVWEGGGDQSASPEGMDMNSPEDMSDTMGGGAPAGGGRGMYGS